ncbi:hypothetical protein IKG31_03720 [Candidatus Saccharibacteria bacterium]|nr:hypothetical protein [Candidatus Saccharibacteria bacterium]
MKVRLASYNISGDVHQKDDDPVDYLDKKQAEDIDIKLLNYIIDAINQEHLDIICFQEIITTNRINYIRRIANKTCLKHVETFELSPLQSRQKHYLWPRNTVQMS